MLHIPKIAHLLSSSLVFGAVRTISCKFVIVSYWNSTCAFHSMDFNLGCACRPRRLYDTFSLFFWLASVCSCACFCAGQKDPEGESLFGPHARGFESLDLFMRNHAARPHAICELCVALAVWFVKGPLCRVSPRTLYFKLWQRTCYLLCWFSVA